MAHFLRFSLLLLTVAILTKSVLSDLIIFKLDRQIDLTSQILRITSTLKVENPDDTSVSEVLVAFPEQQAKNLAYLTATLSERKGKPMMTTTTLHVEPSYLEGMPPALKFYSVSLQKELRKKDSLTLEVSAVFTHALQPFPEKITQAEDQLLLFQDSAHYVSPYVIKFQSLTIKLPDNGVEFYTKLDNTKIHDSEIKYGPYQNINSFSYSPIVVHFKSNQPFAVARELVREIEISHWGNVQITEHYNLIHAGAQSKGEFSRLDYQARPHLRGASAFRNLLAKLPPRAHSVYYRDEIGNISTSNLWGDSKMTALLIEPRYPMFGGWRTAFTIGYGLPLHEFLFMHEGKRFLNITFGSPMNELVIDHLIVKVVLPEGSSDVSVASPFSVVQSDETKLSHLDIAGRPVVVLEKTNVVPEHDQYFQVYYSFNKLSMLREPLMLISGFFFLFVTCIVYMHADMSISKTSASYIAKLQWDEVQATVQQVENIINKCLTIHEKLESSLRNLSRTGDVQTCKAARKTADASLKEISKELKPLLMFLQSSPAAAQIFPKVEDLVAKERELEEKLMIKHATVVDGYEKKSGGKEIESRVAAQQQKINILKQELEDILEFIDEI